MDTSSAWSAAAVAEPQTSWDNHYRLGYNGRWFNRRESAADEFRIQVGGCGRVPVGVTEEAVWAARAMLDKYGRENITLLYSGGCDSEVVLQSFIGAGQVPRVLFLDYGENRNVYDRRWAHRFCRYNGIRLEEFAVPALDILRSGEALELCSRYQCPQSGASLYLHAMERLCKDSFVVAGDEPYLELLTNPLTGAKSWFFFAREWTFSQWKVFHFNGVDGCPNFLQYTAELWLAFLRDPIMRWAFSQSEYTTTNQLKYDLYRQRFFVRPRHKSTGMEKFGDLIYALNARLHLDLPHVENAEVHYPLEQLLADLTRWLPAQALCEA
jgi:hypothetical protein